MTTATATAQPVRRLVWFKRALAAVACAAGLAAAAPGAALAHGGHGQGYGHAHGHGPGYGRTVRCVAKAFTRRGFELSRTRAAAERRRPRAACRVALRRCEARLDYKRQVSLRKFPYAGCRVVKRFRVAGAPYGKPYWKKAHRR
ncbi:MAG: hypothetical protein AAFR16_14665 [Pseudomonadota bacterium]